MKKRFTTYFESPLGWVEISGTKTFISSVNFVIEEGESTKQLPDIILQCKAELEEYFDGRRKEFSVKTKAEGTDFQHLVWNELMKIKYGETKSYGDIAKQMKDVNASRAVGHANGKNPIAIIVPCHRVISENGKLTGYAGGMWRKQWLLDLEGNVSGKNPTLF
jgi:methylated-DNA-[protein]-cysteine S-methyltransferase